jgi:hypothetical protein
MPRRSNTKKITGNMTRAENNIIGTTTEAAISGRITVVTISGKITEATMIATDDILIAPGSQKYAD